MNFVSLALYFTVSSVDSATPPSTPPARRRRAFCSLTNYCVLRSQRDSREGEAPAEPGPHGSAGASPSRLLALSAQDLIDRATTSGSTPHPIHPHTLTKLRPGPRP